VSRRVLVVNGPNLNLVGGREPAIYGTSSLADIEAMVRRRADQLGCEVGFFQSNSEGALLDHLQERSGGGAGVILNPGALTHYSYALYDCVRALSVPVVEVHLSNIYARPEAFRHQSVISPAAAGVISGLGPLGYLLAMEFLIDRDQ
jgi:3-dehydroquinate dehydratase-2